mmetsp:Transcript_6067/g.8472  ORF Transcript_6067/g.8472 Transcript_6067/m.8472 type:complete len:212 (-) Transcript_6067:33-668(-)
MIDLFNHIDFDLAVTVAKAIGVAPPSQFVGPTFNTTSANLSQNDTIKNSIATRKVAVLVLPGYKSDQVNLLSALLTKGGAQAVIVGPKLGIQDGTSDWANATFITTKSVQYDGLILVGGSQYPAMKEVGQAVAFLMETFKHYKGIVALDEAAQFVKDLNLGVDVSTSSDIVEDEGVVTTASFSSSDDFSQVLIDAFGFRHFDRNVAPVPAA